MYTTANMGLTVWNLLTDLFDHTQLENNWAALDVHNHASGEGVQIPTGGIEDGAITLAKLANLVTTVTEGTLASRPAAGQLGRLYYATDAVAGFGQWSFDNTAAWQPLGLTSAAITADTTAIPGIAYVVDDPGITVTLPDPSDAVGQLIAVYNFDGTPTSPTIIDGGSHDIVGPGGTSTTNTLGAPHSCILLLSTTAPNWIVIGGQQDTGWVPLTFATIDGAAPLGVGYVPAMRRIGERVWLRGAFTDSNAPGPIWSGLLPAFCPSEPVYLATTQEGHACQIVIGTSGAAVLKGGAAVGDAIALDGLSYTII